MFRKLILNFVFLFAVATIARAQLSQGGTPLLLNNLKSAKGSDFVELSVPDFSSIKKEKEDKDGKWLKPFRFAHPIPVQFNLQNSGTWYQMGPVNVWQLKLHAAGAKTLNLIFDKYNLPDGARLFLFSEDMADLLGAFTSENNKPDGKFATMPVVGDRLIIQYEEPENVAFSGELSVKSVNYDFVGIKSIVGDRRPLGESGSCNVNVNCDYLEQYRLAANSVCRVLISGTELCTGTLLNNTKNDETPYVYTAGHCIDDAVKATESVFLFNYESPYCGSIDGEVNHSISGSTLKAESDSLDFSLVELSVKPPKSFRPYYLGWSHANTIPKSSVCIHHPIGDIKKISVDRHSPLIKSFRSEFIKNAFFYIGNWEEGTTEGGSSGAAMIDQDMHMVGSLSGGTATCSLPIEDYFARFNIVWDYYPNAAKQLKKWLDPANTNATSLDGMNPYTGNDLCGAFTNFEDADKHENLKIMGQSAFKGYWGGTNDYGFSSFAEKFTFDSECDVTGVSLGVAKAYVANSSSSSSIRIDVFNGIASPGNLLYSQNFLLRDIDSGVMNYFEFNQPIPTDGNFFISYSIDNIAATDTFSVYLAKRVVEPRNTFFIKDGGEWYTYNEKSGTIEGSSILMEAVLCNIDTTMLNPDHKNTEAGVIAYPNPFRGGQKLFLKFEEAIHPKIVQVFDLMGRQINVVYSQPDDFWLNFDFAGSRPGIYFLKIADQKTTRRYHLKVSYLGN